MGLQEQQPQQPQQQPQQYQQTQQQINPQYLYQNVGGTSPHALIPSNMVIPQQQCMHSKYKIKGTLVRGFDDQFPCELTNVMAPQDYSCTVKDINEAAKYKRSTAKFFLFMFVVGIIALFLSIIPSIVGFSITFPICVIFLGISSIGLFRIQKRVEERVEKVMCTFNSIFSSRNVSIQLKKKSAAGAKKYVISIIYPASLSIQPILYSFPQQPIQQSVYQQQPQIQVVMQSNATVEPNNNFSEQASLIYKV